MVEWIAAAAKSLQSCPTLCNPIDSSPPGSPIPGIHQARTLEWVAISFCNAWRWKVKMKSLSRDWLLETPGTTTHQAPPSLGFSRQEYWRGCHCLQTMPIHNWCLQARTHLMPHSHSLSLHEDEVAKQRFCFKQKIAVGKDDNDLL